VRGAIARPTPESKEALPSLLLPPPYQPSPLPPPPPVFLQACFSSSCSVATTPSTRRATRPTP
jgi:hypothetical protein